MKIGLDFGTTYSKIAYLEGNGELRLFQPPGGQGDRLIPSAITYCKNSRPPVIHVGKIALSAARSVPGARLVEYFKPRLAAEGAPAWNFDKSPHQVTHDYLERILISAVDSFERSVEKIDGVVAAAPQAWVDSPAHPTAQLLGILRDELKIPVLFVESEPVCAAALFADNFTQGIPDPAAPPFNLLVCDAGGAGFTATLCRMEGARISVLASESSAAGAGVAFDRGCIAILYDKIRHQEPPKNSSDYQELFKNFERTRLDQHMAVYDTIADLDAQNPLYQDTPLYMVKDEFPVQLQHVAQAFQPIGQGMEQVLLSLKNRFAIDRVVIVGAFGQYPLVERLIRQALGCDAGGPTLDQNISRETRPFAVAIGAMLLANGIVQCRPWFPHTLGVFTNQKVNGVWRKEPLPILRAGRSRTGMLTPEFALAESGQPELLEFHAGEPQPLPVFIQAQGSGTAQAVDLPHSQSGEYPQEGRYKIGALIDATEQVTLVLESENDGGQSYAYPLGSIQALLDGPGNE